MTSPRVGGSIPSRGTNRPNRIKRLGSGLPLIPGFR